MMLPSTSRAGCLALVLIVLWPGLLLADNAYAKRTMADLEETVKKDGWEQAELQIENVQDALKDADEATAAPIKKRLAEIQKLTAAGVKEVKRGRIVRDIENAIKKAREYIDNKRSCEDELDRAKQELESEDNQPFLDAAVKKGYFSEMAVIRKQMIGKNLKQAVDHLGAELASAEKKWPELQTAIKNAKDSPAGAQNAATEMSHAFDALDRAADGLPTDDPKVQQYLARVEKLRAAFDADYGQEQATEALEGLQRYWDQQAAEAAGWEKETTAPTFSQLLKQQNEANSRVGAPQTAKLISAASQWLKNHQENENYKTLSKDKRIKALADKVIALRANGWKKIVKSANAIVTEASQMELNKDSRDRLETFANDDLRLSLEDSPDLQGLQDKALALVKKFDDGAAGSSQAAEKLNEDLTAQATKAWPAMAAKFKAVPFDANAAMKNIGGFKGKIIRFENVGNRMGWDYRPGTFDFAAQRGAGNSRP